MSVSLKTKLICAKSIISVYSVRMHSEGKIQGEGIRVVGKDSWKKPEVKKF